MECGSKPEPGRVSIVAQSADFRIPAIGQTLAVQAFRFTISFAENSRTLAPNTRGDQCKGSAGYDCVVGQRGWFPLVADTQEVLKGERRAGWGYAELLGSVFKICGGRSGFRLWPCNSFREIDACRHGARGSYQKPFHE